MRVRHVDGAHEPVARVHVRLPVLAQPHGRQLNLGGKERLISRVHGGGWPLGHPVLRRVHRLEVDAEIGLEEKLLGGRATGIGGVVM